MNGSTRARKNALSALFLLAPMLAAVGPAQARGSAIDPDPASPSLTELLAREEAARAKAAAPILPVAEVAPAPERAHVSPNAPRGAVRQVYPPSHGGVTVLVPGARSR